VLYFFLHAASPEGATISRMGRSRCEVAYTA
jgi:hypothetical protein